MIKNLINNKKYIGQSQSIEKRWSGHRKDLENKNHRNKHLERSWEKYGKSNFEFTILEEIKDVEYLDDAEKYWIKHYETTNPEKGFNRTLGGDGRNLTEVVIKQISNTKKSRRHLYNYEEYRTDEYKQKISDKLIIYYNKLSIDQINEILERCNGSESDRKISQDYPVSRGTIGKLRRDREYANYLIELLRLNNIN